MNLMRSSFIAFWCAAIFALKAAAAEQQFPQGIANLRAGQFAAAAQDFRALVSRQASEGALLNLGLAEWQLGNSGAAILAWEQAGWLNPLSPAARNNLRYARQEAQLDSPELAWYETASTWLSATAWAWIASLSLWLTVAVNVLPRVLRMPKQGWQQSLTAFGLGIFLLSCPANLGVITRSNLGFVLEKKVSLRLTPTKEGETFLSLVAGDSVRKLRQRGDYCFVRTTRGAGWLERSKLGFMNENLN